jgi:alpha-L-fucosidase
MTLTDRPLPGWFATAQLGIFVHWTMASVPAFAPLSDDPFTLAERHDWSYAIANTPYVEWYENSLAIEGSPVAGHHREHYGDAPYESFAPQWEQARAGWDPIVWAHRFAASGATYVVFVTKHHDGYCLWPTDTPNPTIPNWHSERDLVGELAAAVRDVGMRFGVYYSGGLDWTFVGPRTGAPVRDLATMFAAVPRSVEYESYATSHWHELIDRYRPDVLWNDIHWAFDPAALFEHYYATVPDGVVNDRFDIRGVQRGKIHADFTTPEYRSRPSTTDGATERKFEVCRGMGRSFGYNAAEGDGDYLGVQELVALRDDVFAAGGNLLLNVGPMADGTIPGPQADRLEALGKQPFVRKPD